MKILHPPAWRSSGVALASIALFIASCAPQQPAPDDAPAVPEAAQKAFDLRHAGKLEAAAESFLRAAKRTRAPQSILYRLHAAETYLQAQNTDAVRDILADLPEELEADLRAWSLVIAARVALLEARAEQALTLLDEADGFDQRHSRARDLRETRVQALEQLGRPLDAALERILIEPLLADQGEIDSNRRALWNLVQSIPAGELEERLGTAMPPLRGWMELSIMLQSFPETSTQLSSAFSQWKRRHPNHPGASLLAEEIPAATGTAAFPSAPGQVALLLPLEGQLAEAGMAVRDGFIAAWYADARGGSRPAINAYHTTTANAVQIYEQAAREGAEVVIGPLEKSALEAVVGRGPLTLPTLALNQVNLAPQGSAPLIQFALSPEEEARRAAERARRDGWSRALVMTSNDAWGERVSRAFQQQWQSEGGVILDRTAYLLEEQDFATPVKELLDIDGSQQRADELRRDLSRDLVTEPLPRQDADILFLAADSLHARQIQPQLLFFGADTLPVYATSHVYAGDTDTQRDADLNGITFGDMPGVVRHQRGTLPAPPGPARAAGSQARLFAMGVDAYRLIAEIAAMGADPTLRYSGESGVLSLNADAQIARELTWMRFVDGVATPLEGAPAAP